MFHLPTGITGTLSNWVATLMKSAEMHSAIMHGAPEYSD